MVDGAANEESSQRGNKQDHGENQHNEGNIARGRHSHSWQEGHPQVQMRRLREQPDLHVRKGVLARGELGLQWRRTGISTCFAHSIRTHNLRTSTPRNQKGIMCSNCVVSPHMVKYCSDSAVAVSVIPHVAARTARHSQMRFRIEPCGVPATPSSAKQPQATTPEKTVCRNAFDAELLSNASSSRAWGGRIDARRKARSHPPSVTASFTHLQVEKPPFPFSQLLYALPLVGAPWLVGHSNVAHHFLQLLLGIGKDGVHGFPCSICQVCGQWPVVGIRGRS